MRDRLEKEITNFDPFNDPKKFKLESLVESSPSETNNKLSIIPEIAVPVIGVFTGVFAKLDSMSTNKRFYSENFWRRVLNTDRVKAALRAGTMIGIFEHPNVMDNYDKYGRATARHPINGAFIVKRLWIEGRDIMGEAYILNTPIGKLLATYFLARDRNGQPLVQLHMSARGYTKDDYFDSNGIDQMNPNDYWLQSFDVVLNPGIKGTIVKMESAIEDEFQEYFDKLESFSQEVSKYYSIHSDYRQSLRDELKLKCV